MLIALYCLLCLATKFLSLNNEPYMFRCTIIDLNPVEVKSRPFTVSLDKCCGSCNSGNDLSTKIFVPTKTKDLNVKAFIMITNRNEAS